MRVNAIAKRSLAYCNCTLDLLPFTKLDTYVYCFFINFAIWKAKGNKWLRVEFLRVIVFIDVHLTWMDLGYLQHILSLKKTKLDHFSHSALHLCSIFIRCYMAPLFFFNERTIRTELWKYCRSVDSADFVNFLRNIMKLNSGLITYQQLRTWGEIGQVGEVGQN